MSLTLPSDEGYKQLKLSSTWSDFLLTLNLDGDRADSISVAYAFFFCMVSQLFLQLWYNFSDWQMNRWINCHNFLVGGSSNTHCVKLVSGILRWMIDPSKHCSFCLNRKEEPATIFSDFIWWIQLYYHLTVLISRIGGCACICEYQHVIGG